MVKQNRPPPLRDTTRAAVFTYEGSLESVFKWEKHPKARGFSGDSRRFRSKSSAKALMRTPDLGVVGI